MAWRVVVGREPVGQRRQVQVWETVWCHSAIGSLFSWDLTLQLTVCIMTIGHKSHLSRKYFQLLQAIFRCVLIF